MAAVVFRPRGAYLPFSVPTSQLVKGRRQLSPSTPGDSCATRCHILPPIARCLSSSPRRRSPSERGAGERDKQNAEPPNSPSSQPGNAPSSGLLIQNQTLEWEDSVDSFNRIENFSDLPYREFGYNQHMLINTEFKRALGAIVRSFQAPIIYAFAYGSGVFPQTKGSGRTPSAEAVHAVHPKPDPAIVRSQGETPKMIDFIFGVSHTQHFHSLNIRQNRHHYSALASLGSGLVSTVQDRYGAGVYFNPYVVINGVLIKYGVVNIDTLCRDLAEWDTLYLAGRLHKPVKIIRDNARVRLANQTNLLAAVRTALLMLPETFTERELYATIAGLSYLGDPRMRLPAENPQKVANIVGNNTVHFRRLYAPLIQVLPNVDYDRDPVRAGPEADLVMRQAMTDPTRGNMVRRLPRAFRSRLYFQYQKKWQMSRPDFDRATENLRAEDGPVSAAGRQGGDFDRSIAKDDPAELRDVMRAVIKQTIGWPSTAQALKGIPMSGVRRSLRYMSEKMAKYREGKRASETASSTEKQEDEERRGLLKDQETSTDSETSPSIDSKYPSPSPKANSDSSKPPPSPSTPPSKGP